MIRGVNGVLARALEFQQESMRLVGAEVAAIPEGWVARMPSLPLVWSLNHVEVTVPIEAMDALALVDRHMADLPYRQLRVVEPSGGRVADELRTRGWRAERDVVMALSRQPDRGLDTSVVIEAPEDAALGLMREWTGEEEVLRHSPEAHEQVVEATRLTWRARDARRLGILGRDGDLAGITMVFSDRVAAQVEDVYVLPPERGRGFGRTLVTHAAALALDAGHELVFIVGDAGDWPQHLYGRVGFEPVGHITVLNRGGS